ncbi:hypothetical protein [Paraglaciecola aestuariivivens]
MKIAECAWVHLPYFNWRWLMDDDTNGAFPTLMSLINSGISGQFPRVGNMTLTEGILVSGFAPELSGLITSQAVRPDGYGTFDHCRANISRPFVWDTLDKLGISCSVTNMLATHYGQLDNGVLVSDRFCKVTDPNPSRWPVPLGSVSLLSDIDTLINLRWHPSILSNADLLPYFNNDQQDMDRFGAKHFSRMLTETSIAHSVATHYAEKINMGLNIVRYPLLDEIAMHLSKNHLNNDGVLVTAATIIDQMIGRLISLVNSNAYIVVTSAGPTPFAIVVGNSCPKDTLFDQKMTVYDFLPSVANLLGFLDNQWLGHVFPLANQASPIVKLDSRKQCSASNSIDNISLTTQLNTPPSKTQNKDIARLKLQESAALAMHYHLLGKQQKALIYLNDLKDSDLDPVYVKQLVSIIDQGIVS